MCVAKKKEQDSRSINDQDGKYSEWLLLFVSSAFPFRGKRIVSVQHVFIIELDGGSLTKIVTYYLFNVCIEHASHPMNDI